MDPKNSGAIAKISREKFKRIWQSRLAKEEIIEEFSPKAYITVSVVVNIVVILAVILLIKSSHLPPQVPLFYGLPEGEGQLAQKTLLVTPAIISLITILLNSTAAWLIKDNFLKKALAMTFVVTTFFSTVTTIKIIFLVGV